MWDAFVACSAARGSSGFGANPIAFVELEAYQRLSGDRLMPREVALFRRLDALYLRA